MTMTVETVSKEASWTEGMASRWTNPPGHAAPSGPPVPTPTPTRRRKHLMVGMSGLFVLLSTTCQFESFQGNMTRLRRLRAGFFFTNPQPSVLVVVNDDDDDDDYNNNDNHEDIYNDYLYNGSNPHVLRVRDWGCSRRHEAPLIFVHLGKCGGGSVRARLAASALDYHRDHWANVANDSTYYYPMLDDQSLQQEPMVHRGIFASSSFYNFRPSYPQNINNTNTLEKDIRHADKIWKTFEKTLPCHATTPLGQAIACPLVQAKSYIQPHCQNDQRRCNLVYAGHNLLGNELHWLPTPYLAHWWNTTVWAQQQQNQHSSAMFESWWQERITRWNQSSCQFDHEYDHPYHYYKSHYRDCVAPREAHVDQQAHAVLASLQSDWSALYASLPVLRITMLREPFAWLVSKFFWHRGMHGRVRGMHQQWIRLTTCHGGINISANTTTTSTNNDNDKKGFVKMAAWVAPAALKQIYHLCGEECLVRHHAGLMTLEQLETQARHNLLQSFAVVGLLHETPKFYDMITARVAYMNTTLNPNVTGSSHSTQAHAEYQTCRNLYQTPEFQQQLLAVCPELQALVRLYHVGVAVNRHQIQEMQSCGTLPSSSVTTYTTSTT